MPTKKRQEEWHQSKTHEQKETWNLLNNKSQFQIPSQPRHSWSWGDFVDLIRWKVTRWWWSSMDRWIGLVWSEWEWKTWFSSAFTCTGCCMGWNWIDWFSEVLVHKFGIGTWVNRRSGRQDLIRKMKLIVSKDGKRQCVNFSSSTPPPSNYWPFPFTVLEATLWPSPTQYRWRLVPVCAANRGRCPASLTWRRR